MASGVIAQRRWHTDELERIALHGEYGVGIAHLAENPMRSIGLRLGVEPPVFWDWAEADWWELDGVRQYGHRSSCHRLVSRKEFP